MLVSLTVKRKAAQVLKRCNEIHLLNSQNFIPAKQHNPKYIFPSKLLPRLDQVIIFLFSLIDKNNIFIFLN